MTEVSAKLKIIVVIVSLVFLYYFMNAVVLVKVTGEKDGAYIFFREGHTEVSETRIRMWEEALTLSKGKENDRSHRLPDVIGIGVQKCGTGALRRFLAFHPYMRMYKGEGKFFRTNNLLARRLEDYRNMLPAALPHELVMEKTPFYFRVNGLPKYLHENMPNTTKLILLLCNPVRRALSSFAMMIERFNAQKEEFDQFVQRNVVNVSQVTNKIIREGIYHRSLEKWSKEFKDRLLVINGEKLLHEPGVVFENIQKFLNIPLLIAKEDFVMNTETQMYCLKTYPFHKLYCLPTRKGRTRSANSTKYAMTKKTEDILRAFYEPYNKKLFSLLSTDFRW